MTTNPAQVPLHDADHELDEHASIQGYVRGTDFSLPYLSAWSRLKLSEDCATMTRLLRHMNCSYLSTPGEAPTLLALKQHAQSLCALILEINPTLKSAEILTGGVLDRGKKTGSRNKGAKDGNGDADGDTTMANASRHETSGARTATDSMADHYELNDAFDFLADLGTPYWNDDANHHKPLWALTNEVKGRHEALGTTYHCPFAESEPRGKDEPTKPYASHHNLIVHANACLERLDHEFSAVGGLLGLLPTTDEHEQHELDNAANTLLGQWLLFTQHLVGRMQELEHSYGNALDILSGEAAIPWQHLSSLGPDGRSGREMVYPQDRWVLVNSGDDVFEHLHALLDRQEALKDAKDVESAAKGTLGHALLKQDDDGSEYARGIVPLTIATRYYRLAGQGRNTIFVVPAYEEHPELHYMRELERRPTVVSSIQPMFPKRVTELESRYNARIRAAEAMGLENLKLQAHQRTLEAQHRSLTSEVERLHLAQEAIVRTVGMDNVEMATRLAKSEKEREALSEEVAAMKKELATRADDIKKHEDRYRAQQGELRKLQKEVAEHEADAASKKAELAALFQKKTTAGATA